MQKDTIDGARVAFIYCLLSIAFDLLPFIFLDILSIFSIQPQAERS